MLNGSFVTTKESPEDFDCILVLRKCFDFRSLEAKNLRLSKELFGGHILSVMQEDTKELKGLIELFGHDREGRPKGIIEVIL